MAAIEEVEWEDCCVEPRRDPEIERFARAELGFVDPRIRYLSASPWVARTAVRLTATYTRLAHLDQDVGNLAILVVSHSNSCRYCFAASRLLVRTAGIPDERIRRLEQDLMTADVSPRERAALELARKVSRWNPAPGAADLEALRNLGWTHDEVRDVALSAATVAAINRLTTLPAIPVTFMESLPDRTLVRLFRPLISRYLKRVGGPPRAPVLDEDQRRGPFAYLVEAVNGTSFAARLRSLIDDAWSAPELPPRTKALVCAVVARSLDDAPSEREASRLLAAEGFPADDLEEVLSHLASPRLDTLEAEAVIFARETVHYRPALIQRRARALREKLGPEQQMGLIGMTSVANMLSRLGVLVAS